MIHTRSAHQQFYEEGYIVYPQVFKGEQLAKILDSCNHLLEKFTVEQEREDPNKDFFVMQHLNHSRFHQESREHFNTIMETVSDPRCLGPIEQIFDGPSLFRATSLFVNPRFSSWEGSWHRDCQARAKDEEEEKEILRKVWKEGVGGIQFQIALVDNDDVEFVPYSGNRLDSPEEYDIRLADNHSHSTDANMPNALRVSLKAGDALIFNPYGLHRGRYHKDIPRRTLMLTYTPLHRLYYDRFSMQPWFEEPGYLDGLSPRATVYFTQFTDAYRDYWADRKEDS